MNYVLKLTEDQAVQDQAFAVEVKVYSDGVQVKPSAATVTVYDSGGDEALAATAMTIDTAGTLTYSLADTYTADLDENAILGISYTVGGVTYKTTFFFDVVINALYCNVTDDDLKAYFPQIKDELWTGDDAPANYAGQIAEAFLLVKRTIKDKGKRPAMLIDGSQVRELVIIKTFEMIFFNFAKDPEGIWWKRYEAYKNLFAERFASLVIKYDEDESGTVEGDEEESAAQVTFQR